MACFLSLECSSIEGSVALMESKEGQLNCLSFREWQSFFNDSRLENSHSDKLPVEVNQMLISTKKKLSDIDFLAVGTGPGRWTGVRTAVNVARTLAFSLKLPVYTLNSLRVSAEEILPQSQPVFVAVNGFKNQIYTSKLQSQQELEGEVQILNFSDWCTKMRKERKFIKKEPVFCISDLEDFYSLPEDLKSSFLFKKLRPRALKLAEIIFRKKSQINPKTWDQVQAFYLRSPTD